MSDNPMQLPDRAYFRHWTRHARLEQTRQNQPSCFNTDFTILRITQLDTCLK